jgi:hypothetical protein
VEVVVVIGIIAIMTAVAIPNFLSSQRRAEAGRHNNTAASFYMALQQTLLGTMEFDNTPNEFSWNIETETNPEMVNRVSGTDILAAPGLGHFMLYVHRHENGTTRATMIYRDNDVPVPVNIGTQPSAIADVAVANFPAGAGSNDAVFAQLMRELENYMTAGGQEGHYYAMFDSYFRVVMVYYSQFADWGVLFSGGSPTSATDNRVNNHTFGAFPIAYSFVGRIGLCHVAEVGGNSNCPVGCTGNNRSGVPWFDTTNLIHGIHS